MLSSILGNQDGPKGVRIARIRGVDVHLDFSWYIIAILLTISLTSAYLEMGVADGTAFLAGLGTTALFFLSIVGHELGHAEAARRFGIRTHSVNLHLLGGAARLARNPRTPNEEYVIAGAGPAVSLGLGAVFYLGSLGLGGVLSVMFWWLGVINLVLSFFNVLPAFPLDGGRMLRGWLWEREGSMAAATQRTVQVGSVVGTGLVVAGIVSLFTSLGWLTGLMLVLTGMFLKGAGKVELLRAQMREGGLSLFDILQQQGGFGPRGGDRPSGFGGFGAPGPRPEAAPPRESSGKRTMILQDGTEIQLDD